jgi:signal transduction histidine kinase/DNA-binding response OmpR family regulator/HAMP domain-containing protein
VPGAAGTWKDLTDNVNQLAANLSTQVRAIADVATAVTKGDLTRSIQVEASGEVAVLKDNINEMIRNLKDTTIKNNDQDWLKTNLAKFTRMLQGQKDMLTVGKLILSELAPVVGAQQGVFYVMEPGKEEPEEENEPYLKLLASYAFRNRKQVGNKFTLGEGLVGQAALEKERILVTDAPADYVQITSGLGQAPPTNIIVLPVLFEGNVKAVMELSSFERFSAIHQAFLDQLVESIGIVLNTIEANTRTEDLLKQSQSLAKELQSRQEELQNTNQELQEKAKLLAEQNSEVERKNAEVEQARQALEEKAEQLALTSKYKSEFTANMSHELRTPLNSLLILSQQLSLNTEGNLTTKQVEFAKTIHASGNDLLTLINDILDLSKIESGTVTLDIAELRFAELQSDVERLFRHVAETRSLEFRVDLDDSLPRHMFTDSQRLEQVIRNLLSNAFKFTERGSVVLSIAVVNEGWSPDRETLRLARSVVAFSVSDTGIGIAPEKQQIIFEAFQQADGSTSRKYGGTGLGLAISREIARLLGGEIRLASALGQGSTFTLYVPLNPVPLRPTRTERAVPPRRQETVIDLMPEPINGGASESIDSLGSIEAPLEDDRSSLKEGDRVLLIVEDDPLYAGVLLEMGRQKGFKGVVAPLGSAGLALARDLKPSAITLDIRLPDVDGWRVLNRLKVDLSTRHIPVHIIAVDDDPEPGRTQGALGYLKKPENQEVLETAFDTLKRFLERPTRNLLLIEDDEVQQMHVRQLIGNGDVHTTVATSGQAALEAIKAQQFDCVVLDLGLPDMSGVDLLEQVKNEPHSRNLPILIYTAREVGKEEESRLRRLSERILIKDVRSPDRLLDETARLLHRDASKLNPQQRQMLEMLHQGVLEDKRVLLVDDDIRNIFAMTSVLERFKMQVISAENGKDAIQLLMDGNEVDVALMDIMLPTMDGYATIRAIREIADFAALPIIAVTAKAMKGDREKCIAAGASDYLAKPVDTEQLRAVLRLWLQP